jgi:hypothetical protein
MAHTFPFSDFTGFAQDADSRLTGASIARLNYTLTGCDGCAQIAGDAAEHCRFYERVDVIPEANQYPRPEWWWAIEGYIQTLDYIGNGIAAYGYRYNAGAGNNFSQSIATFEVASATGQVLTLTIDETDPRACVPGARYENPDWPLSGARYLSGTGGGSIQQFDWVTFGGSPLAARDVQAWVVSVEYVGTDSFKVTLNRECASAAIATGVATPTVTFRRRIYSGPAWDDIRQSKPFQCELYTETPSMGNTVNLVHIAHPRAFSVKIDGVEYGPDLLRDKRVYNDGSKSVLYLGATNWDGSAVEDLTALAASVTVSYYGASPTSGTYIGQAVCDHQRVTGRLEAWGDNAHDEGDYTAYCALVESAPSGLADFDTTGRCFAYHCDNWTPRVSPCGASMASVLASLWMATDWYMMQAAAGFTQYFIYTKKHPSIFYLLGHWRQLAPVTWRERIEVPADGTFVDDETDGAHLNENYDYEDITETTGEDHCTTAFPAGATGQLQNLVSGYDTKYDPYDWTQTTTNNINKYRPYFQNAGYAQDDLDVSGAIDETCQQRGGEIEADCLLSFGAGVTIAENQVARGVLGSFDINGAADESGVYGLKLYLKHGLHSQAITTKVSGSVYDVTRIDADTVRVDCNLALKYLGKIASGQQTDLVYPLNHCGNIVELIDYLKPNNVYFDNTFATDQKAQAGDTLIIDGRRFAIKAAYAASGAALSYVPSDIGAIKYFTVPAISTGMNLVYKIDNGDEAEMTCCVLAYCETCDRERKHKLNVNLVQWYWECAECGEKTYITTFPDDDGEFEITGVPPGEWLVENGYSVAEYTAMSLAADEFSFSRDLDEEGTVVECFVHLSSLVLDFMESPSTDTIYVYYAADPSTPVALKPADNWPEIELTADDYAGIAAAGGYVQIWNGDEYTDLANIMSADYDDWFPVTGDDKTFSFYKVPATTKIRFHPDHVNKRGRYYVPVDPPAMSSAEYYAAYIAGMPGLRADHEDYGCLADVLDVVDHGFLTDLTAWDDLPFSVAVCTGGIHDSDTATVYLKAREAESWIEVDANDDKIWHREGVVLVKASALAAYDGLAFCVKVS